MSDDLTSFTDILGDVDEIADSQPLSLLSPQDSVAESNNELDQNSEPMVRIHEEKIKDVRPSKYTGQRGDFRSIEEIAEKYRHVFIYPYFNLVQSRVIDDALYTDKSMVVCAPTGSGKTVIFELAIVQLLMELEEKNYNDDFKIIYRCIHKGAGHRTLGILFPVAPVKALCTERLTEWHSKFTSLGLLSIEVTGDTDVDFTQLKPYRIIITTPEKWDMLTRRWRDHRSLVEVIKLFLIDEVHILNDAARGPVLEAVVSRMKTIELSAQSAHRIEKLQKQYQGESSSSEMTKCPHIRFVAVSATVNNPEDVAAWLGTSDKPAVFYKFGDESRPVKLNRVVEGYPCPEGTSIFKFDITLNYKLWPVIQKYHNGKPTLIFCNTRKSVLLTAETLVKELTVSFTPEQKAKLMAVASTIRTKKIQLLVMNGVGCHHAGLLYEERNTIEQAFRRRDLPILITTTTLAMGVNLPAHLVIIKNTQRYNNGAYEEYSISTILQMVGRAGRPQFDTEATAVIMTRLCDKPRYQALVGGSEPLQSYLHKRLPENLNSEAALGTVTDVAQCVQWLRSTFLFVRAARDPKWYLGLPPAAPMHLIFKKLEELCVKAMNMLATAGLIRMDEASCIESTDAGKLMSIYYLDLETMKLITKIEGSETLEQLLMLICESHELSDMHLRVDERRCLNTLNRNNAAATIRFPMKGKINSRQMKLNCIIQAVLGCLPIPDPSLNQEAMKVMRIAERICRCLVAYVTRSDLVCTQPVFYNALLNSLILSKCVKAHLWENSPFVSKQLKGIGPTFSTLLATAGKTTFSLLLESHPRDLERIMNKGPPAGNVLRKQISLLPQYQITMIPIDEKRVSIQLLLINQAFLAENQDNLTAGSSHASYVIVGDSENHVLLFTQFIDRDLIGIYNGTINYEITRKHNFEHKILANCVSSKFVGIDTQCEYVFKSLEPVYSRGVATFDANTSNRKTANKQITITDVYPERKRKNTDQIAQSKEKKRRDSALLEKIKFLKESFGNAVKEMKNGLDPMHIEEEPFPNTNVTQIPTQYATNMPAAFENFNETIDMNELDDLIELNEKDFDNDDVIVDQHIDNILNDIENEISNNRRPTTTPKYYSINETLQNSLVVPQKDVITTPKIPDENKVQSHFYRNTKPTRKSFCPPKKKQNTKTNFSFIDSLGKESVEEKRVDTNKSCFSDSIKDHIEKFLQTHKKKSVMPDKNLEQLIVTKDDNESKHETIIDLTDAQLNTNEEITLEDFPDVEVVCDNVCSKAPEKDESYETVQNFRISPQYSEENKNKTDESKIIIKEIIKESNQPNKTHEYNPNILPNNEERSYFSTPDATLKATTGYVGADISKYNSNEIRKQSHDLEFRTPTLSDMPSNNCDKNITVTDLDNIVENNTNLNKINHNDLKFGVDNSTELLNPFVDYIDSKSNQNMQHDSQHVNNAVYAKAVIEKYGRDSNSFRIKTDEIQSREMTKSSTSTNLTTSNESHNHIYGYKALPTIITHRILIDTENNCKLNLIKSNALLPFDKTPESTPMPNLELIEKVPQPEKYNNFILAKNIPTEFNIYSNEIDGDNIQNTGFNILKHKFHTGIGTPYHFIPEPNLKYLHEKTLENTDEKQVTNKNYYHGKETDNRMLPLSNLEEAEIRSEANSSCSVNDYKNKNDSNGYIKRMSYSSSQINVQVKDTKNHKVQIISKLKVDLDVTQIVSKKNIDDDYYTEKTDTDENNKLQPEYPVTYSSVVITQFHETSNANQKLPMQHTSISNSETRKVSNNLEQPKLLDLPENTIHFQPNIISSMNASPENNRGGISEDTKVNYKSFLNNEESVEVQENSTENGNKESNVKNILNKYKAILGNGLTQKAEMPKQEIDQNKVPDKYYYNNIKPMIESLEAKRKRPYKISDLHNNTNKLKSNIPLKPQIIKEKTIIRSKENTADSTFSKNSNRDIMQEERPELKSKITVKPQIIKENAIIRFKENTDDSTFSVLNNNNNRMQIARPTKNKRLENEEYDNEIHKIPLLFTDSPTDYDLPVDEIDNAMFNPKTLLQCYQKESEEIIPPPFQFCDSDNNHSPVINMQEELNETTNYSDTCDDFERCLNNTSIFECDYKEQLTPTKEIETWTLSQDDYETPNVHTHKSCTSPHYNVDPKPSRFHLNKRENTLSAFKFRQKDRMKLKY